MNLKSLLKVIKENESKLSTLLGMAVILIFGVVAINYFRNMNQPEELTLPAQSDEQIEGLPATHVVGEGENLWKIAETYYKSGYNWVDIAEANEIPFPGNIETGQELSIPAVEAKKATVDQASPLATVETPQEAPTKVPTSTPDPVVERFRCRIKCRKLHSRARRQLVENRTKSLWRSLQMGGNSS